MMPRYTAHALASLAIALAALAWGVATMSRYGVTFDAPSLFYAGDRTLFALRHPDVPHALDMLEPREPAGFQSEFAPSPERNDVAHYPVLPGLLCAVTSAVLHDRLHWLD